MPSSVFDGTADLGRATLICSWVFTGLAVLSICCTILHIKRVRSLSAADYVTFSSFVVGLVLVAQTTWAVLHEGQGVHADQLDKSTIEKIAKSLFANESLWSALNTLLRVAALLILLKIFRVSRLSDIYIKCVLIAVICHGLANLLTALLICKPIAASWDNEIAGVCGDQKLAYLVFEILGCVLDLWIITIPAVLIRKLQMSLMKKIQVILFFSGGSVVIIVTGLRIQAMSLVNSTDISYNDSYIGLLSAIGGLLGIVAGGITVISSAFNYCRQKFYERRREIGGDQIDEGSGGSGGENPVEISTHESERFPPEDTSPCSRDLTEDSIHVRVSISQECEYIPSRDKPRSSVDRNVFEDEEKVLEFV